MKAEIHFEDGDILPITLPCEDSFEAMNLLRDLIERDKPKKLDNRFEKNFRIGGTCPSCESSMYVDFDWTQFRKFCDKCGQRLDWSE